MAQTPLLHLYVYLLDKSLSGTLVLTTQAGARAAASFDEGAPTRVMDVAGIRVSERTPLERVMVKLCELEPETRYAFYGGQDLLADRNIEVPRIEPLAIVMACARACVGSPQAEATLRRIAEVAMGLAPAAMPERFRLSPEEGALVQRLRKQRTTLADLAKTSGVPPRIVRGVIYGLTITRHLDFGGSTRPPVGIERAAARATMATDPSAWRPSSGTTGIQNVDQTGTRRLPDDKRWSETTSSPVVPPARSSSDTQGAPPNHEKRRAEIEAKLASAPNEDFFQMLGIGRDAGSSDVRNAYFGLAKVFHPDKLPKDLHDLKPRLARLFGSINAAYEALKDDAGRAHYLASLGTAPKDEAATVARVVDAAFEFEKAEVFLRKNDVAAAEACAKRAVAADPEQPAYAALLAWVESLKRPLPPLLEDGKTNSVYDDLLAQLDAVLRKEPDYEKAVYYRAVLLKRSGRVHLAYKDFKRSSQLNPKNIESTREVRLYEMRHPPDDDGTGGGGATAGGATGGGATGGGLFGKFFKKR